MIALAQANVGFAVTSPAGLGRAPSLQRLIGKLVTINYKWRYDANYYAAVVDRYYRQLPFLLHLPSQFTLLWILGILAFSWITGEALREFAGSALLIGAIAIPAGVVLTKQGSQLRADDRDIPGSNSKDAEIGG